MKILSYRASSPTSKQLSHKLMGIIFASAPQSSYLPTTINANASASANSGTSANSSTKWRTFSFGVGKCRLLTFLQLLSLFVFVCTLIVYTRVSRTHSDTDKGSAVLEFRLVDESEFEELEDDRGAQEFIVDVIDVEAESDRRQSAANTQKKTISADTHLRKKKAHSHQHPHNHKFQSAKPLQLQKIASAKDSLIDAPTSELFYDYGGPMQNREQLDNVFLSVKSTKRFHETRLDPILKTWFNLAKNQTWFFTDDDDPELAAKSNGHLINTHCPPTHYRQALCCKMSAEFDTFLQTTKSWFCHFDDDNYVNVPALLNLLGRYSPREYWYLGKPSLKSPIKIMNPDNQTEEVSFWFATGGAGFCLSRALALRMSPLASGGKFMKACDKIQLPDDVTMGYIAGHLLGQNLTVIPQFHSHFETMKFVDTKNPSTEITFSYVRYADYENTLEIDGLSKKDDPTRFLSLHCHLFPRSFTYCSKVNAQNKILSPSNTATGTATTATTGEISEYSGAAYYKK